MPGFERRRRDGPHERNWDLAGAVTHEHVKPEDRAQKPGRHTSHRAALAEPTCRALKSSHLTNAPLGLSFIPFLQQLEEATAKAKGAAAARQGPWG